MPHSDMPLKIRPPPGLEMMPLSFDRAGSAHGFDVPNAFIAAEDPAYVHCAIDDAECLTSEEGTITVGLSN